MHAIRARILKSEFTPARPVREARTLGGRHELVRDDKGQLILLLKVAGDVKRVPLNDPSGGSPGGAIPKLESVSIFQLNNEAYGLTVYVETGTL